MATISTENISVKHFIQAVLINDIGNLVRSGNHYLGFGTQTQAIELLGAIIEDRVVEESQPNNPDSQFNTPRKSRRRFHNALKLFSNPKYTQFCPELKENSNYQSDFDLYDNLRCGFAHQMRPTGKISLTTEPESIRDGTSHLEIDPLSGRLIIVSEVIYLDLKAACERVIAMIESREIDHTKPYGDFLGLVSYS